VNTEYIFGKFWTFADTEYIFWEISYFCGYRVYDMEFKWSLDENMCVLFSMMSVLDAKQQAMVTVSRKFVELNNLGLFAYMHNM
jgi:hypothetical protein